MSNRRVLRREDAPLLRGEARFVADLELPGALHAVFVRSPHAHARVLGIDAAAARAHGRVIGVFTAADLGELSPIPVRVHPLPQLRSFLQYPLARDKVRYVGDPVAAVVAADRYIAEDAAELVEVDYEPLPAVVDADEAVRADAPLLFEETGSNVAHTITDAFGAVDEAFAGAHVVVSGRFSAQRHTGMPMETRGLLAAYDEADERLTVWGPTKVVHANRAVIAPMLGLPEERVRFVEPAVGGGFGIRGEVYPEDVVVPLLALRLRRPVKWIEDRREHLLTANHSREQVHEAELAVDADGRLLGLRSRAVAVLGGYLRTHGVRVPEISTATFPGPYRIPAYRCEMACVLTNKTPSGTYRAPGRFEVNFVRERLLDLAARELGLDPAEIRRRNLVTPEEIPYMPGTEDLGEPIVYESGDFPAVLEHALEAAGYGNVPDRDLQGRRLGAGICCFLEDGGLGGLGGTPGEYARVVVDGGVTLYSGVAALGQGLETVLAQVCADELGVDAEEVTVVHGDTDRVPWGGGTWASRSAILACGACVEAARAVRRRLRELGADTPSRFADAGPVEETVTFTTPRMTYSPGAQIAVVAVDEETGAVELLRHVIAYDVGRALNPMIVEGQIQGGGAQGIGGALLEELAYDAGGQPLATSFMDYLLPGALDVPAGQQALALELTPSPLSPLGVKGVGEVGPAGAGAAIANAVAAALSDVAPPVDVLPLRPDRVVAWARGGEAV